MKTYSAWIMWVIFKYAKVPNRPNFQGDDSWYSRKISAIFIPLINTLVEIFTFPTSTKKSISFSRL